MIQVHRIAHASFETPDLARQIAYYSEIVGFEVTGRDAKRAILSSRLGHEIMVLEQGETARCTRLAFEVAPDVDLGDAVRNLAAHGVKAERRSHVTPDIAEMVAFQDPKGTDIELFATFEHGAPGRTLSIAPMKLGHVAFLCGDAKAMTDFYVETLGFRVSDWMEDFFSFLRCGPDHHTVNFRTGAKTFMHHIAFELKDWAHLQVACETLGIRKRAILWGPLRHGIGHNIAIYTRDPDDHIVEFYTEMDQMKNEALGYFDPRPWHEDRPQRPKIWDRESGAMVWGTPPAPDYLRSRPPLPVR